MPSSGGLLRDMNSSMAEIDRASASFPSISIFAVLIMRRSTFMNLESWAHLKDVL